MRESIARLVKSSPDEIALTRSATEGVNIVAHGLTWQQRDEVITTTLEHPGGLLPLYVLKQRYGVIVNVLEIDTEDGPHQILEKIEANVTPRTRLIAFSHVAYNNGHHSSE